MTRRRTALLALVLLIVVADVPAAVASRDTESSLLGPAPAPAALAATDLGDLAEGLDYDIERIFRFVADEIRYEPYPGILRGARGTLASRAGNSVDQALLLAALLDESLVSYRFARAGLDEAVAAGVIDSISVDTSDARRIAEEDLGRGWAESMADFAQEAGSPSGPLLDRYQQGLSAMTAQADARLDLAGPRLSETVTMIQAGLDEAGVELPADAVALPPSERLAHTWVQAAFGADWLDLDPTMASSQPGTVLAQATERLERLPDDLRHRVEVEVLVERVAGDQLLTDTVLEYAAFADEVAGVPLTFGHITPSGAERMGVALSGLLGGGLIEYRPFLQIGAASLVADEAVEFGLAGVEGDGGLLDDVDLFDDAAASATDAGFGDGEATAEWLTVSVIAPDAEPVIERRTVFDRLPADVRHGAGASVDAISPIELVELDGAGSADFAPMLGLETFAVATGSTDAAALLDQLLDSDPDGLGLFALAFHGVRDALGAEVATPAGARTFVDSPNIVSYSVDIDQAEEGASVRVGLDIWHRGQGILPLTGSAVTVAEAEIIAGVAAHLAERVTLGDLSEGPASDQDAISVGAVFEIAARTNVPTIVLHGAVAEPLPFGAGEMALIEEAIDSGDVVLIPEEPVVINGRERVGWWRIDPSTGATTDVMDDGTGATTTEYVVPMSNALRWATCIIGVTSSIVAVLGPVVAVLATDDRSIGAVLAAITAIGAGSIGGGALYACLARKPAGPRPFPSMPPGWRPPGAMPAPPLPRGPFGTLPRITHWGTF